MPIALTDEHIRLALTPEQCTDVLDLLRSIQWAAKEKDLINSVYLMDEYGVAELAEAIGAQWEPAVR